MNQKTDDFSPPHPIPLPPQKTCEIGKSIAGERGQSQVTWHLISHLVTYSWRYASQFRAWMFRNPQLRRSVWFGSLLYLISSLPLILDVVCGYAVIDPGRPIPYGEDSILLRFAAWDGGQFMQIMDHGYFFDPTRMSNVVFFPGFPCAAKAADWSASCSSFRCWSAASSATFNGKGAFSRWGCAFRCACGDSWPLCFFSTGSLTTHLRSVRGRRVSACGHM